MNPESGSIHGDFENIDQLQEDIRTQDDQNDSDKSKYEVFFDRPYALVKEAMAKYIESGNHLVDIGVNQGNLEDFLETKGKYTVDCVDVEEEAISKLKAKNYQNIEINPTVGDANEYIDNYESQANVILINATLHEINNPADQRAYLEHFLGKAKGMLGEDGRIIIGDYYYPDHVTDEEVAGFIEYQKKAINHADAREKFVRPELIKEMAVRFGFELEHFEEIRAVEEIDRRYYVIVLKKAEAKE